MITLYSNIADNQNKHKPVRLIDQMIIIYS